MVEKFQQGESSGRKSGPASADCCWLEEKSDDFLTASQIAGFSSRLPLSGEGDHLEALVGTADFVLPIV